MPKLTVKKIIDSHLALSDLIQKDRENKFVFPSSIRLRLAGNLRQTKPVFEEYETERLTLVEKLGTPPGVDGKTRVKNENIATFKTEHEAMLKEEYELQLVPLNAADLGENQIPIDTLAALQDAGLLL